MIRTSHEDVMRDLNKPPNQSPLSFTKTTALLAADGIGKSTPPEFDQKSEQNQEP